MDMMRQLTLRRKLGQPLNTTRARAEFKIRYKHNEPAANHVHSLIKAQKCYAQLLNVYEKVGERDGLLSSSCRIEALSCHNSAFGVCSSSQVGLMD